MHDGLKEAVFQANIALWRSGMAPFTWGNVSGIDREEGLIAIKPSGVPYDRLMASQMVLVTLAGELFEPQGLRPSSDTATHLAVYQAMPQVGGVVHTHSKFAVAWAQAGKSIPALGTTHADYFYGDIPCTRLLEPWEVEGEYERNTGLVLSECMQGRNPMEVPGALARGHGPFAWGGDCHAAVEHACYLELIAEMAYLSLGVGEAMPLSPCVLERHYRRKHGKDAYYGQVSQALTAKQ